MTGREREKREAHGVKGRGEKGRVSNTRESLGTSLNTHTETEEKNGHPNL
jgi:hypothetical protein